MASPVSSLTGTFTTKAGAIIGSVPEYARAGYTLLATKVGPTFLLALEKTKEVWIRALPYIKATLIFSATPLGISIIVIGASIIPLRLSRSTKSNIKSIGLLALGILMVGCGGILFANSGIIPGLALKTVTVV